LPKWILVLALACSVGAHWPLLQSVAWVGMAISYSQGTSVAEGLAKTFDGKHPCKLCRFVSEGKKSERKPDSQKLDAKFDLFCAASQALLTPPSPSRVTILSAQIMTARNAAPPLPPPRPLLG
jgi:hypothetical protein